MGNWRALFQRVFALLVFSPGLASAITWNAGAVSHEYTLISSPKISWDAAAAWTKANLGQEWYLATITTAQEQAFINSNVLSGIVGEYLVGGFQAPQASAPQDNWHWVTGEPWRYTNWSSSEPNDNYGPGSESYLGTNFAGCCWNDEGNFDVVAGFIAERTTSQTVTWNDGTRSHEYRLMSMPKTSWNDAAAWVASNLGPDWYLATITSAQEQDFVNANVFNGVVGEYLIGGFQDPQTSAPRDNWHWVTGEPWSYTNWWISEPNDNYGPGSESFLAANFEGCCWNDEGSLGEPFGFVAERTLIPEPSTALLLGMGFLVSWGWRAAVSRTRARKSTLPRDSADCDAGR
jgi:hypothetical protein